LRVTAENRSSRKEIFGRLSSCGRLWTAGFMPLSWVQQLPVRCWLQDGLSAPLKES